MRKAVKIKTLTSPSGELSSFDPGRYLSGLDFYETDDAVTASDREAMAQLVHLLAHLSLKNRSDRWPSSTVTADSAAFRALNSHFSHLDGWDKLATADGILYRSLASFLIKPYPPRRPTP